MLRNFFISGIRHFRQKPTFGWLNVTGLALGLAVFTLIALWVNNERSYNMSFRDNDRIAEVMLNVRFGGKSPETYPASPPPLAAALGKDFPAFEYTARSSWGDIRQLTVGDKNFSEYGLYVDPEFIRIFSVDLLPGSTTKPLESPNTILLSESLAKKYFGAGNPVGKTIMIENNQPYQVSGVFRDLPPNVTISYNFLMPMHDYIQWAMGGQESWANPNIKTFVKLKPEIDRNALDRSLKDYIQTQTDQQPNAQLLLWDLKDWYLRFDFKNGQYAGGGRIIYVRLFTIIGIFILLLACINFMNLSTARATKRAREVGVRKAVGAGKASLIMQFIGESVLTSVLAGVLSIVLVAAALPALNQFLNRHIPLNLLSPAFILQFIAIVLITGVVAGSYPAFVLSRFRPVKVLKSNADQGSGNTAWVRKVLVVGQFAISIMLIIGTAVIYRQVNYIRHKDLGYNKENLLWFQNSISPEKNEAAIAEFRKVPGIVDVARASMTFTSPNNRGAEVNWPGKQPDQEIFFSFITGDQDIIQTMGINMKEGRPFSRSYGTDTGAYILNEEAVRQMGLIDPVGKVIETHGGKGTIVGIAKNFHFESMHHPIAPTIIECRPDWTWLYYVRIAGKDVGKTIAGLESVYQQMAPGYQFHYEFQDQEYEKLYRSEEQIGSLVSWFAFFAIFISCLGLLGLTIFTVERKTREIGIRKVLGSSVSGIVVLVSRQFLAPVLTGIVLAIPLSWYFMNQWLQDYTYRADLSWWLFAGAGLLTVAIALITVAFHAVKAGMANPVRSLRSE